MLISLPPDKVKAWSTDIKKHISTKAVTKQDLESLIGRLNHIGFIIPLARHFLNRLRSALRYCEKANRRKVKLTRLQLDDLHHWLTFIDQAGSGINLNLITYRQPTRVLRTDACQHGIGGVSLTTGTAWRFELPSSLLGRTSLNCLEFLGNYVGMLVYDHYHGTPDLACYHGQGDSTSAAGWMHKSNFLVDDEHLSHIAIARDITDFSITNNSCITTQWFPGKENNVADCLSRDFHLSDFQLTALLRHFHPDQLPPNFVIRPVPSAISSRITSLLLLSPPTTESLGPPTRSELATGDAGRSFLHSLGSRTTSSSTNSLDNPSIDSSLPSPKPSELENLALTKATNLHLAQSLPPWTTWRRPLGTTTGKTHGTMPIEEQRLFYSAKHEATRTPTPQSSNKRPCPQNSSNTSTASRKQIRKSR